MKKIEALVMAQKLIESSGKHKYVEVKYGCTSSEVKLNGKRVRRKSERYVEFFVGTDSRHYKSTGCAYSTMLRYLKMPVEDIPRMLTQIFKYPSYELWLRDLLEQRMHQCST